MKWSFALLVAACHGDGHAIYTGDAPAGFDAPAIVTPDGSSATVSIAIRDGDEPDPAITIIFTNPDGSPIATATTDAMGAASQEMALGGFVTLVDPLGVAGSAHALVTYAGVKPGDQLVFARNTGADNPVALTVPLAADAGSGATYDAQAMCSGRIATGSLVAGSASATGTLVLPGCGQADVLVRARAADGSLAATLWHPALALPADLTATDAFTPASATDFAYANLPAAASGLTTELGLATANGVVAIDAGSALPAGGSAQVELQSAAPYDGAAKLVDATDLAIGATTAIVIDLTSTAGGDYALDAGSALLPTISSPAFAPATAALTWTEGSGAPPDFTVAALEFAGDPALQSWAIVGPYAPGALQFPPIPGYLPQATDAITVDILSSFQVVGGYDAARTTVFPDGPTVLDPGVLATPGATGRTVEAVYRP